MKHKIKTIIILTGLVSVTLHIINKIMCSVSTVKQKLISVENHYYEWRFGRVHYIKKGNGTPLLLLHDLTVGSSHYEFHHLIQALSKNHEVYAIDLLGYGLSDKSNMTYTNYLYVQQVNDFIKNVIGRKADILATGDSAPIAVMACHNDSDIIQKMIFINPQSLYQLNKIPSKQTKLLKMLIDFPIFGTFIYYLFTTRTCIEKCFLHDYFYNTSDIKQEDVDFYYNASHYSDYKAKYSFSSYISKYTNANIIHALKEINNSIYIIAGKEREDNQTILENYLYYNHAIETVLIPNTKQLPHLEKPEEVLNHLNIFLS